MREEGEEGANAQEERGTWEEEEAKGRRQGRGEEEQEELSLCIPGVQGRGGGESQPWVPRFCPRGSPGWMQAACAPQPGSCSTGDSSQAVPLASQEAPS